jgi:ankyrin repeat protein
MPTVSRETHFKTLAKPSRKALEQISLFVLPGAGDHDESGSDEESMSQLDEFFLRQFLGRNSYDSEGYTPLHRAIIADNLRRTNLLLISGADPNITTGDSRGDHAVHIAALAGHTKCLKLLLAIKNIDVNCINKAAQTALICACKKGHVVRVLPEQDNLDINTEDCWGKTALMYACEMQDVQVVQLLFNRVNLDINHVHEIFEESALMNACQKGHADIVRALLKWDGLHINAQDRSGRTALMYACEQDHADVARVLFE